MTNKQGSGNALVDWPEGWSYDEQTNCLATPFGKLYTVEDVSTPGNYLTLLDGESKDRARKAYDEMIAAGISKEQARGVLPLTTYTECYWKIDLHNLFGFLRQRMDSHAQLEIREYATIVGNEIVAKLFPMAWEAFCDYQFNAMKLSSLDIAVLQAVNGGAQSFTHALWEVFPERKSRERDECRAKLLRMGFKLEAEVEAQVK